MESWLAEYIQFTGYQVTFAFFSSMFSVFQYISKRERLQKFKIHPFYCLRAIALDEKELS